MNTLQFLNDDGEWETVGPVEHVQTVERVERVNVSVPDGPTVQLALREFAQTVRVCPSSILRDWLDYAVEVGAHDTAALIRDELAKRA